MVRVIILRNILPLPQQHPFSSCGTEFAHSFTKLVQLDLGLGTWRTNQGRGWYFFENKLVLSSQWVRAHCPAKNLLCLCCCINGANTGFRRSSIFRRAVIRAKWSIGSENLWCPKPWCCFRCLVQTRNIVYVACTCRSTCIMSSALSWFPRKPDQCPILASIEKLSGCTL